jgi:hypothetical protein
MRAQEREALETRADSARARLATELDAVFDRGRGFLDPAAQLRRHPKEALIVASSLAALLAASIGLAAYRTSIRNERARTANWARRLGLFVPPGRTSPKSHGFLVRTLERSVSSALVAAVVAATKYAVVKRLERFPVP